MVKQWPFDMLGTSSVSSAVAYDADERKYLVDLVPLFKGLADLQTDRATKGVHSEVDFWADFLIHVDIKDIHERSHRHVKQRLSEHWRLLTGAPFPPHTSSNDCMDEAVDAYEVTDALDSDSVMQDAVSVSDELPDMSLSVVG